MPHYYSLCIRPLQQHQQGHNKHKHNTLPGPFELAPVCSTSGVDLKNIRSISQGCGVVKAVLVAILFQILQPDDLVNKSGLDLTITDIVCSGLSVQYIELSHNIESNTVQWLRVEVMGVQLTCDYWWECCNVSKAWGNFHSVLSLTK